ncbi:MAG: hypothetical protein HY204_06285 [Nitrospirae bacterium]|nr:hypothetical protein [Nitrospirota bacterium]
MGQATTQTIAVVAGTGFPKDRLTLDELKAIYLGEIHLLKDLWIHPMDQRENQPIRKKFLERVVKMTRDRYIEYWNQRLFRYGGFTPLFKNNSREVIETVREQEGTVGYVWLEEIRNEPGIKTLLILDDP